MSKFQIGDSVMLKSEGRKMTVSSIIPKNGIGIEVIDYEVLQQKYGPSGAFYECHWTEGKSQKEETFPEESLELSK